MEQLLSETAFARITDHSVIASPTTIRRAWPLRSSKAEWYLTATAPRAIEAAAITLHGIVSIAID